MQDVSARLSLPFILPSQAQKHVTHNEAVSRLDLLVHLVVESFDATTPPAIANEGQTWALGAAPIGAWAGHADQIAAWINGGWIFITPQLGWQAVAQDDYTLRLWDGSTWRFPDTGGLNQLDGVGVGTSFDSTNRLSVVSQASLLSHDGGGHQLKINKNAGTDTASVLFQTGFSGRAEMGTTGTDDFELKVSADGTTWTTGLRVDAAAGKVTAPQGLDVSGSITGSAVMQTPTDITVGKVMPVGAGGFLSNWPSWTGNLNSLNHNQYRTASGTSANLPEASGNWAVAHWQMRDNEAAQIAIQDAGAAYVRTKNGGTWQSWRKFLDSGNTTVDANGFIKQASPIVRLSQDGAEEPVEHVGAKMARKGIGHYTLTGVAPLASHGWQIEVPKDHNGNRLVFVQTSYNTRKRVLTVKTKTVIWDARKGIWVGGTPIDIPPSRWVDLRFQRPDTPQDAQPEM